MLGIDIDLSRFFFSSHDTTNVFMSFVISQNERLRSSASKIPSLFISLFKFCIGRVRAHGPVSSAPRRFSNATIQQVVRTRLKKRCRS
jgi:hypothetical protein